MSYVFIDLAWGLVWKDCSLGPRSRHLRRTRMGPEKIGSEWSCVRICGTSEVPKEHWNPHGIPTNKLQTLITTTCTTARPRLNLLWWIVPLFYCGTVSPIGHAWLIRLLVRWYDLSHWPSRSCRGGLESRYCSPHVAGLSRTHHPNPGPGFEFVDRFFSNAQITDRIPSIVFQDRQQNLNKQMVRDLSTQKFQESSILRLGDLRKSKMQGFQKNKRHIRHIPKILRVDTASYTEVNLLDILRETSAGIFLICVHPIAYCVLFKKKTCAAQVLTEQSGKEILSLHVIPTWEMHHHVSSCLRCCLTFI